MSFSMVAPCQRGSYINTKWPNLKIKEENSSQLKVEESTVPYFLILWGQGTEIYGHIVFLNGWSLSMWLL